MFHMANLLNNIMAMDMGNVSLLFNIDTFHAMILFYIFERANTKQQK